ncbi:MAG: hypothetical protein A4E56_00165 [Pelotomaculum sp. PtaU1.Bin065]|nr:MAG: hypothetical protein A4E56_00165 [Pelotomaculum sp. PtaU1.Bin065]
MGSAGGSVSALTYAEMGTLKLEGGRLFKTETKCPTCGGISVQTIPAPALNWYLCQYCKFKWNDKHVPEIKKKTGSRK